MCNCCRNVYAKHTELSCSSYVSYEFGFLFSLWFCVYFVRNWDWMKYASILVFFQLWYFYLPISSRMSPLCHHISLLINHQSIHFHECFEWLLPMVLTTLPYPYIWYVSFPCRISSFLHSIRSSFLLHVCLISPLVVYPTVVFVAASLFLTRPCDSSFPISSESSENMTHLHGLDLRA